MGGPSFSISNVLSKMRLILYTRAREFSSPDPIIKDPKLVVTISLGSRPLDLYVTNLLSKHHEGIIINPGCGLDTCLYITDRIKNP